MDELNDCCQKTLIRFVKASWLNFPEETKKAFEALARSAAPMPVITLTYETRTDRQKTNASLASLGALQLISWSQTGQAKSYQLTEFGGSFAEELGMI